MRILRAITTIGAIAAVCGALLIGYADYAGAQGYGETHKTRKLGSLITGGTLDAASHVATVSSADGGSLGYAVLSLYVKLTDANSSVTNISMSCTGSHDGGTTDYTLQSCAVAAGTCTSTNAAWSKTLTAQGNWIWRVDILGYQEVECTFTDTGGLVADTLDVTGTLVTQ